MLDEQPIASNHLYRKRNIDAPNPNKSLTAAVTASGTPKFTESPMDSWHASLFTRDSGTQRNTSSINLPSQQNDTTQEQSWHGNTRPHGRFKCAVAMAWQFVSEYSSGDNNQCPTS
jgi:hypothetical protein